MTVNILTFADSRYSVHDWVVGASESSANYVCEISVISLHVLHIHSSLEVLENLAGLEFGVRNAKITIE